MKINYLDKRHPYGWRTWIRTKLPQFLINLGVAEKGDDCASVGGEHAWYKITDKLDGCYHCKIVNIREDKVL